MVYVNIVLLLLFAAGYAVSQKGAGKRELLLDKSEHKLYFLYPMAELILTKLGLDKRLCSKDKVTDAIKKLHVTSKTESIQRLYWCNKIALLILIIVAFSVLSLISQLQTNSNSKIIEGKYLMRPDYGEGSEEVKLSVILDEAKPEKTANQNKEDSYTQDITIQVNEQQYSEAKLSEVFEQAKQYLDIVVLGDNISAELIYEDLIFPEHISGTSISVEWKPEDNNLINRDGSVSNEDIDSKGVTTSVNIVLSYGEKLMEYIQQFHIMPMRYSKEELLRKKLEEEIESVADKTSEENRLELPETIGDYNLNWTLKDRNTATNLLFLGFLLAALVWIYWDKELEQKMKKRKEQMLLDYPEIINKFTLLVNAGMTVKQAWEKITDDYGKKAGNIQHKKRYAYEEMLVTVHELKLGIPESNAYEQFGRRVGLLPYIKFSSLIAQNLKKGSKGLSELLNKEAFEAFEERKETAKRLGEEAGTKLLIPMMIMLVIVFVIILVPAFRSFEI